MSGNKIKVLCVDDSALIRSVMTEIINSQAVDFAYVRFG